MLGEAHVLEPAGGGGGDHLLQRAAPVTRPLRMDVQVSADVVDGHQVRQAVLGRRLHLADPFPDLRRHEVHAEGGVHLLLGGGGDDLAGLRVLQPVLVEQPAGGHRPLPQVDVVLLRPGEVDAGGAELPRGDHPDVDLQPAVGQHRGLGWAGGDHLGRHRQGGRRLHHRRRLIGGDHDVDVPDGVAEAAEASAHLHLGHPVEGGEVGGALPGDGQRLDDRGAPVLAVEPEPLDRPRPSSPRTSAPTREAPVPARRRWRRAGRRRCGPGARSGGGPPSSDQRPGSGSAGRTPVGTGRAASPAG